MGRQLVGVVALRRARGHVYVMRCALTGIDARSAARTAGAASYVCSSNTYAASRSVESSLPCASHAQQVTLPGALGLISERVWDEKPKLSAFADAHV